MILIDLLIPFISIFLAEFGDKTQIAVISMSVKINNHFKLFVSVFLAFLLVDGLAIYFADLISNLIPLFWIKLISGILFIIFGLHGFFYLDKKEAKENSFFHKNPFISSFLLITFAEFGDKTQIVSGLYATIYSPILVFIGIMFALSILTLLAIYFGEFISTRFDKKLIEKLANSCFLIIGLITLALI